MSAYILQKQALIPEREKKELALGNGMCSFPTKLLPKHLTLPISLLNKGSYQVQALYLSSFWSRSLSEKEAHIKV